MKPEITHRTESTEIAIQSLFLDYDGTISPPNVSRISSGVPEEIGAALKQISSKIPVVIVTSKDPWFVVLWIAEWLQLTRGVWSCEVLGHGGCAY